MITDNTRSEIYAFLSLIKYFNVFQLLNSSVVFSGVVPHSFIHCHGNGSEVLEMQRSIRGGSAECLHTNR